ncbi:hypothetical protein OROHE_015650 [Orobanche hederae]
MDEKGKYLLSLGYGALLGSAATLVTSKLLLRAPSDTVVVKGLPQKTTEEDLYQILAEWGPVHHIRVIKERRSGISRGFAFVDFPYVVWGILGVAGGLFQPHLGEKMLRKPNFRMLPCSDRGCSGCYEETIVGCCLERDLSGRVGYSSASQAGTSTVKD